jgi:hypothetical protein
VVEGPSVHRRRFWWLGLGGAAHPVRLLGVLKGSCCCSSSIWLLSPRLCGLLSACDASLYPIMLKFVPISLLS